MLDLGWPELLVVALVLILVVGPKDLPGMLRTFGRTTRKLRAMAGEFRSQFDEALKEAELDDVKNVLDEAKQLNPTNILKEAIDPIRDAGKEIKADLDKAMKEPAAESKPAATKAEAKSEPEPKKAVKSATGSAATKKKPPAAKTEAKAANNGAKKKAAPRRSTTRKPAEKKPVSASKPASEAKKPARRAATRKTAQASKSAKTSGETA
ncbi:Sec-independent protein translocase protein TatB [Hoeflea poritis]|uniref:Sec-independent protein translocase protein TatB n=1 Tax=Hoeflea poritis TaxID=2993659 RepID=A0ABT4VPM8_9HYPH|nr:Sec-independent protein translocase protein TatB [Hoeflea poritis]MDA4846666.1 Sec-independent protein translocase protein TatB [Hoeflea poritis]